jgi:hypothetical protein
MAIYKTVTDILLRMVASGELTKKQTLDIRDAHENERAEWRSKMVKVAGLAYEAGRKHDTMERKAIVDYIVSGVFDV